MISVKFPAADGECISNAVWPPHSLPSPQFWHVHHSQSKRWIQQKILPHQKQSLPPYSQILQCILSFSPVFSFTPQSLFCNMCTCVIILTGLQVIWGQHWARTLNAVQHLTQCVLYNWCSIIFVCACIISEIHSLLLERTDGAMNMKNKHPDKNGKIQAVI